MSIILKRAHLYPRAHLFRSRPVRAASRLSVRARCASATQGVIRIAGSSLRCALGRSGITHAKREGDGATPAGAFELLGVYFRPDRVIRPRTRLPVVPLTPDMGWCDAPGHADYNRLVARPFTASHEMMWRADALYDIVVVMNCNVFPAVAGRGSAIFLHLARPGYAPTEGCVAVSLRDMRRILVLSGPGAVLAVGTGD